MDNFLSVMETAMDGSKVNQNSIANNISNYNTPDYKAERFDFDNFMKANIESGGEDSVGGMSRVGHIPIGVNTSGEEELMKRDQETKVRSDGNNINMNTEMIEMIKANSVYERAIHGFNTDMHIKRTSLGVM